MILSIKIFGFLYKIISTRMLGLEGMRLISMIMPSLSLCLCISSLSIQTVCNQNIASNLNLKTTRISVIMLSCLRVTLASSSIISIFMLLSFPLYKYLYQDSFIYYPLLLCIPLLFFSNTSGVMKGYLEANNNFKVPYFSNFVENLTKLAATITLLYIFKNKSIEFRVAIVFFCLTLSELSSNLVLSYKIKRKRKIQIIKTNFYEKKVLMQAIPLTLSSLIVTIGGYITPFIYYYACKKAKIDFYESTTYFALITSYAIPLLTNGQYGILTISKFLFPNITKNFNNSKKLYNLLDKAFILSSIIAITSFSLCFFQPEFMLKIMYKDTASASIVKFLAPIFLLIYFDPILVIILEANKKEKYLLWITLISQIISIILIYVFSSMPFFNKTGYLIGFSIGAIIKCVLLFIIAFKISNYKPSRQMLFILILITAMYILFLILSSNIIYYFIITALYLLISLLFYYLYKDRSYQTNLA